MHRREINLQLSRYWCAALIAPLCAAFLHIGGKKEGGKKGERILGIKKRVRARLLLNRQLGRCKIYPKGRGRPFHSLKIGEERQNKGAAKCYN